MSSSLEQGLASRGRRPSGLRPRDAKPCSREDDARQPYYLIINVSC